jgi:hypothetical protein
VPVSLIAILNAIPTADGYELLLDGGKNAEPFHLTVAADTVVMVFQYLP